MLCIFIIIIVLLLLLLYLYLFLNSLADAAYITDIGKDID